MDVNAQRSRLRPQVRHATQRAKRQSLRLDQEGERFKPGIYLRLPERPKEHFYRARDAWTDQWEPGDQVHRPVQPLRWHTHGVAYGETSALYEGSVQLEEHGMLLLH